MPINVLITGSDGLLGWHTRCLLHRLDNFSCIPCNRQQFADDDYLDQAIGNSDAIFHLAGANRGEPDEVARINKQLVDRLVIRLSALNATPHVLFSNSIHIHHQTAYGRSKLQCAEELRQWAEKSGGKFTNLVLPHVFGEHGKPFYNSVVSTFAHQIVAGDRPRVQANGGLELLHAGQVAELFVDHLRAGIDGDVAPSGEPMTVSVLLERMSRLWDHYSSGVMPPLKNATEIRLFNTMRSMMTADQRAIDLKVHSDDRGALFEVLRCLGRGQVFYSTTDPGITRGNHFHTRKVERFLVVQGEAEIKLRRVLHHEVLSYRVSGERPQVIDMPTLHTHSITNVGKSPLCTLFWCNEHFNADDPDTFFEVV